MSSKVKDFLMGVFLSLSKAEQEVIRNSIVGDQDSVKETQVRKEEIKIVSQKRFYELLEKADDIQAKKYEEQMKMIKEQRGLSDVTKSFKNARYGEFFESHNGDDSNIKYKFKTTNGLYKFADNVYIRNINTGVELSFLINLEEHSHIKNNSDLLSNLSYFEVQENAKIYSYNVTNFLGVVKTNPHEMILKFEAIIDKDGEYTKELTDDNRVMRKSDLIKPADTFFLR